MKLGHRLGVGPVALALVAFTVKNLERFYR